MKLLDLKEKIDRIFAVDRRASEIEVVIDISLPYATVGGSPCAKVRDIFKGIDWDNGKLFICPKEDLTISDEKIKEVVKKMQKQMGDLSYENMGLKAQIKQLRKAQEK